MKLSLLPLVVVACVLAGSMPSVQASAVTPDIGQIKKIVLHGQNSTLTIFQNGSAFLFSDSGDTKLPRLTFSFAKVYEILTPDSVNSKNMVRNISLASNGNYYGSVYRFNYDDQNIIDKLLTEAGVRPERAER